MTHNSRLRGPLRSVGPGYPGPGEVSVSFVPGQDGRPAAAYDGRAVSPDIRQMNAELRRIGANPRQHPLDPGNATETKPMGVRLVPGQLLTGAQGSHMGMLRSAIQLALPYNKFRKRLIIPNNDQSATTVYFCYGNSPFALITIPPGATYDESGSAISTEEVYICDSAGNKLIGFYEGILDLQASQS